MQALLVDDDPQIRRALGWLLRNCGFTQVIEANDGQHALIALGQNRPNLIITDCQMPKMDGITLTRALRTRGQQAPIIMISGQADPQVVELALEAGVNHYVAKPLHAQTVTNTIQQALGVCNAA
jgi:CheY-like chemotaxis protein